MQALLQGSWDSCWYQDVIAANMFILLMWISAGLLVSMARVLRSRVGRKKKPKFTAGCWAWCFELFRVLLDSQPSVR